MRILFLTHAFNSLTQRLFVELSRMGHELSIEFDIKDSVTLEAVELFRPHLILTPYLRRAIPEVVWKNHLCLVLHPGPVGDRGPSALDWAILRGEAEWGVTLLQAEAEMDAGPVWASETFPMRAAKKSSLYRNEVTEAAVRVVKTALERLPDWQAGRWRPRAVPLQPMHALMRQEDRAIDWYKDSAATVLAKINSGDGFPGVTDTLFGQDCQLYNARPFPASGAPGELLGRFGAGLVRATLDGAVWIGHCKPPGGIKLPLAAVFAQLQALPELTPAGAGDPDIRYEEAGDVGYLHFDFYNGAMDTGACQRLLAAYQDACRRPTRVIVLMGGADFFSNGLDLNRIEAADSPADASLENIEAMDDLCQAIIETTDRLTVAALQGNAGAGGAFLALAADRVWAREGILLNPHYKNMGNLYGSEYWTYLLPRRVGAEQARQIMARRLPLGAREATEMGFVDACLAGGPQAFLAELQERATALAADPALHRHLAKKQAERAAHEAQKPLAQYRSEELAHMQRNFYGFDPSYHVARYHFVRKTPHSWTPRHLCRHRELGWRVPDDVPAVAPADTLPT